MGLVLAGGLFFMFLQPIQNHPCPHRASQGYLAGCTTSIHTPTILGARLGLRLVTTPLGEM